MNKSKIKTKVNLKKLRYNNNKKVGEGSFGAVYDLHNNKRTNKKYVVKKIKTSWPLLLISFLVTGKTAKSQFNREVQALTKLSKLEISPKIFFFDKKNMMYIIEKLDYSLEHMIKNKLIKPHHINKLILVLKKIQKTNIRHNDLHSGNIMYSKSKNKFFIIDLGLFEIVNECDNDSKEKICYKFDKENANYLSDLFLYLKSNTISKKNSNLVKKQYLRSYNSLKEVFNLKKVNHK